MKEKLLLGLMQVEAIDLFMLEGSRNDQAAGREEVSRGIAEARVRCERFVCLEPGTNCALGDVEAGTLPGQALGLRQ